MAIFSRRYWKDRYQDFLRPELSDEEIQTKLQEVRQHLPVPVFWLLGKTQSGKSSLIQALTGSSKAEIGNGFQPCTRTAHLFEFPDNLQPFIRFLDTRGLAEADYDPQEDMQWCEHQSHLLIVVVRAMDHQQGAVAEAARQIRRRHPDWPILVVQTALHEGYPDRAFQHIQPYPFAQAPFARGVPPDLQRSLLKQRGLFNGIDARFVPVDFTQPDEGYEPAVYGLEALWDAIEAMLPLGLRGILAQSEQAAMLNDAYAHKAHPHIIGYALSAGLAAMIPVPLASTTTVTGVQAKLFHSIAAIYGVPLTLRSVSEVTGAVGLGALAGMGARELTKLIPVYGQSVALGIAGLYTAAVTYGLGRTFCFYFAKTRRGQAFTSDALRQVFREEFQRARQSFRSTFKKAS